MAERSPSMWGHFSPSSSRSIASAAASSSPESQFPQPHSRRPSAGTWTTRPQLLHRTLGIIHHRSTRESVSFPNGSQVFQPAYMHHGDVYKALGGLLGIV